MPISRKNVGRIAERIVSNELEFHGFAVSNLNREGIAANADLLATRDGETWQIQVKGATNEDKGWWWFQYGYCTDAINNKAEQMFNRVTGFYRADIVVLVAVYSPKDYCSVVLPVGIAERAAQLNLDRYYRTPTRRGERKKPGPVWLSLIASPRERKTEAFREEREILNQYKDDWERAFSETPRAKRHSAS